MLTNEQLDGLTNRFEAAFNYLNAVETKPTPCDLYYPIKRPGVSTGWGYHVTGITVSDLANVVEALKQLRGVPTVEEAANNNRCPHTIDLFEGAAV